MWPFDIAQKKRDEMNMLKGMELSLQLPANSKAMILRHLLRVVTCSEMAARTSGARKKEFRNELRDRVQQLTAVGIELPTAVDDIKLMAEEYK